MRSALTRHAQRCIAHCTPKHKTANNNCSLVRWKNTRAALAFVPLGIRPHRSGRSEENERRYMLIVAHTFTRPLLPYFCCTAEAGRGHINVKTSLEWLGIGERLPCKFKLFSWPKIVHNHFRMYIFHQRCVTLWKIVKHELELASCSQLWVLAGIKESNEKWKRDETRTQLIPFIWRGTANDQMETVLISLVPRTLCLEYLAFGRTRCEN